MKNCAKISLVVATTTCVALGQGTVLWDESVNGPLSQYSSAPTVLAPLQAGTNTVIGMTEIVPTGNGWTVHPDFFTFTLPGNLSLGAVFFSVNRSNVWTWIGDSTFSNPLGFAANSANGDLLPQWGLSSIGPGAYGVDVENHDAQTLTSVANYRLDFLAHTIPEPSTVGLLLLAGACALATVCLRMSRLGHR